MSRFPSSLDDITDPSDFRTSKIPALEELDVLERCYICKEFFNAPVITSCNHTFCSQCIREYLITNNSCPLCKSEVYESNLKKDGLLEEIVRCYARIRPYLLSELRRGDEGASHDVSNAANGGESADAGATALRKLANSDAVVRNTNEEAGDDDDGGDEPASKRRKVDVVEPIDDGLVACPVCSRRMTAGKLQGTHLDACLSGQASKPASPHPVGRSKKQPISSFFQHVNTPSPPPAPSAPSVLPVSKDLSARLEESSRHPPKEAKRLAKLDFASLSTVKLKEKLAHLHLPMSGNRNQLELRYNQYFVLFNSNIDSNHPVSERVLRQRLHKWELSHSSFSKKSGSSGFGNGSLSSRSISDKNFSVSEWTSEYKSEFDDLVKSARKSMSNKVASNKDGILKNKEEQEQEQEQEEDGTTDVQADAQSESKSESNGHSGETHAEKEPQPGESVEKATAGEVQDLESSFLFED
ncbi:uncharacterized protein LODBEIA_P42300 [Lodderomyces beijingensis]|uniref:Postreplication repair E3 ubiquitin-protein ligase RAD18 n=1 Tax=Lodderomyces beijingensis TaxID=1775926 RepID=A0ABP0ZSS0_9ASCO